MKATLTAMWRLFHVLAFYPVMIGAFIWLYIKEAHWIGGALIIAAIFIFDPIWRAIGQNILRMVQKK